MDNMESLWIALSIYCIPYIASGLPGTNRIDSLIIIDVEDREALTGELITIPVNVSNTENAEILSYYVALSYDSSFLDLINVKSVMTEGADENSFLLVFHEQEPGNVVIVAASPYPILGTHPLLLLEFQVGDEPGSSVVGVDSVLVNDGTPYASGHGGEVSIRSRLYGDSDQNGSVSTLDASRILQHATGLTDLSGAGFILADVTGNGVVGAYDASFVLQKISGMIPCFPVEKDCLSELIEEAHDLRLTLSTPTLAQNGTYYQISIPYSTENVYSLSFVISTPRGDSITSARLFDTDQSLLSYSTGSDETTVVIASPQAFRSGELMAFSFASTDVLDVQLSQVYANEVPRNIAPHTEKGIEDKALKLNSYPNPAGSIVNIEYSLPGDSNVQLAIFDVLGRRVLVVNDAPFSSGRQVITLDISPLAPGLYHTSLIVDGVINVTIPLVVSR